MGDFDCANPTDGTPLITSCCTAISAVVNIKCSATLTANGDTPDGFFPAGTGAELTANAEAIVRHVVNLCNATPFGTSPNNTGGTNVSFYTLRHSNPSSRNRIGAANVSELSVLTARPFLQSEVPYDRFCYNVFPSLIEIFGAFPNPLFTSGAFYNVTATGFFVFAQKAQIRIGQASQACFATFPGCSITGGVAYPRASSDLHLLPALDPVGVRSGDFFNALTYRIFGLLKPSAC